MSHKLTFGDYEGKTFEWLFFNAPWYAEWLFEERVHRQEHCMDEVEGDYFRELHRRAQNLAGTCSVCHEQPLTRIGLTTHRFSGCLGMVGLYCDNCDYTGGSLTEYYEPSMLFYGWPRCEQKRITAEIRRHYLGDDGRLTQKKMEEFFHNDANFSRLTPGFFNGEEVNT